MKLYPEYHLRKGSEYLRTAFLLLLIAFLIAWVPLVSIVGSIVELVGVIFLILGWRSLGRSDLRQAKYYGSTGNWIIFSIVGGLVIAIVGFIAAFAFLLSSITKSSNLQAPLAFQTLSGFIVIIIGIIAIVGVLSLYTQYRILRSLKHLSKELEQPRLSVSANLWVLGILSAFAGTGLLFWFFFSRVITSPAAPLAGNSSLANPLFGSLLFTGLWPVELVLIAATIVEAVSAYFGYTGIGNALEKIPRYASTPYGMPAYPSAGTPVYFCPQCGQKTVSPDSQFCSNCGRPLRP